MGVIFRNLKSLTLGVILAAVPMLSMAQADTAISFIEVVQVGDTPKDQLFQRARSWFASSFKDSKSVLEISDKEAGELAGKGVVQPYYKFKSVGSYDMKATVEFQIRVLVKDGRYKYQVSQITHLSDQNRGKDQSIRYGILTSSSNTDVTYPMVSAKKMDENYQAMKQATTYEIIALISSLKKAMETASGADDF